MSTIIQLLLIIFLINIIETQVAKDFEDQESIPTNSSDEENNGFEDKKSVNVIKTIQKPKYDSFAVNINKEEDIDLVGFSQSSGVSESDSDTLSKWKVNANHVYSQSSGIWVKYKYDKQFILVNKLATQREAEIICKSLDLDSDTTLAIMQSSGEQQFVNYYLFRLLKCIQNVWIGVKKDHFDHKFHETNGVPVKFTNWGHGSPSGRGECVQLRSPYSVFDLNDTVGGKWEDIRCDKKNYFLCQRRQGWSKSQVQRLLIDFKKEVDILNKLRDIEFVTIGFVYVQYPTQLSPKELWPLYNWKEISDHYQNLFFRALGPNTEAFSSETIKLNTTQISNSPRLIGVQTHGSKPAVLGPAHDIDIKSDDSWSQIASSSSFNGVGMAFKVSDGEVRPRNTCIRMWKRVP